MTSEVRKKVQAQHKFYFRAFILLKLNLAQRPKKVGA